MEKKNGVGNIVVGESNFATILPGHIFKVPEVRKLFHPHAVVMYFSETLEQVIPGLWLIEIILVDNPDTRLVIDLAKLNLSERQKQELIKYKGVPKDFFRLKNN